MTWSLARARRAASEVRAAPLGRKAGLAIRPRGQFGFLRSRPPLTLLLCIASQDGLIVEHQGGFAVLRRPEADTPAKTGGMRLRIMRWLCRHWDMALFGIPPASGLAIAAATAIDPDTRHIALIAACAVVVWVNVFLLGMICSAPSWMARIGLSPGSGRSRDAEDMSAEHWSVGLVHQPDADRTNDLIQRLVARMDSLIRSDVRDSAEGRARIDSTATEYLVVLHDGVTTHESQAAVANSPRRIANYPAVNVYVLEPPDRADGAEQRTRSGGGFFLLYLSGLAAVLGLGPWLVANTEERACPKWPCTGRPTTYDRAAIWIWHRLIFTDPAGDSPHTLVVKALGGLVSAASVMLIALAVIAVRRLTVKDKEDRAHQKDRLREILSGPRVLILVVTETERDAVLRSVRGQVENEADLDGLGSRTIYWLGTVANCKLLLAQAGEQGTNSMAAMPATASEAIARCNPDCVVLTGICFGLRPERGQQLGDVVIARRIQDLNHVRETDDPYNPTVYRGVHVGPSPELLDRFQAGQSSWQGVTIHAGTVLTSNTLVNSSERVARLRRDFPDAIAGEMEATGVYEATTRGLRPDWIMVKAISDWGFDKTEDMQQIAAQNAADFVTHVIATGTLRRPPDRGPR